MKTLAPKRRSLHRVYSLSILLLLLCSTSLIATAQGSAVRVETFLLRPGGEIAVENPRGETRVESWNTQTVRVVAEKRGRTTNSIQPGELVLMGAGNSIVVQCKPGDGQIDLTVYLPNAASLQVTGGTWPVEISGGFAGAIVETTSGSIAYHLPSNDDARISMRSIQGAVRSTMQLTAIERTGTRSLRGQIGTGDAQIVLNSQSGNLTLAPAPVLSASAKASRRNLMAASDVVSSSAGQPAAAGDNSSQSSVTRDDPDATQTNAPNQRSQGGSTIDFAGTGQSSDSNSTTRVGPLTRPRNQRNTSSGSSGLNVRIIPAPGSPTNSTSNGTGTGPLSDRDTDDASQSNQPSANSSGSQTTKRANANSSPSGGTVPLAGSDRADNGTSNSRIGPLERNRQTRNTTGGDSGLRVRIIPASAPPAPSRTGLVFDNRDVDQSAPSTNESPSANPNRQVQAETRPRSVANDRRIGSDAHDVFAQDENAATDSRSGGAPVLRRNGDDGSSSAAGNVDVERTITPGEEAVVLKSALVNLNVSVTNRSGVSLANLKKEDFEVAENGQAQKIEFFQTTSAPFNLVLLLDLSGSIKDKLDVVKAAALRFVDVLSPRDKVAVVTFTDQIRVVSQLTEDREELRRRIRSIDQSRGGTAFYEALWFSLVDTLRGTGGQRNAVVVMTDGVDSSLDRYNPMQSRVSFNQVARRLEEADVILFPIYLDTEYEEVFERGNSSSEAYAVARDQLERIAEISGGQIFRAEKVGDLAGVYKQIAAAIRTVYSVGYYPTNAEKDGTFRRVRVLVNRSDAAVRTRKGYYAK